METKPTWRKRFNTGFPKHPMALCIAYIIYILIIGCILVDGPKELIPPTVAPLGIIIGMFVWRWQEGIKKHNERAEIVFKNYNQYEKSIQTIYKLTDNLNDAFKPSADRIVTKFKSVSKVVEGIRAEIEKIESIQIELYSNLVLFYYLQSSQKPFSSDEDRNKYIYSKATNKLNHLHQYKYIREELSAFIEPFDDNKESEQNRESKLQIKWNTNTKRVIDSFNFGDETDPREIIYVNPRRIFVELTKFK